jgi:hypothetical protein
MKFFSLFALLLTLVGCEDVSSKRRPLPLTVVDTPDLAASVDPSTVLNSGLHRERGVPVLSTSDEIKKILTNNLPDKLYRQVPALEKDDEGSSTNVLTMTDLGRPQSDCGTEEALSGISARMLDCSKKNDNSFSWDGKIYGAAGEGVWKLVAKIGAKELWLDERTGLVWSYVLDSVNWCKASGNTEMNTSSIKFNCATLSEMVSVCSGKILEPLGTQVKWRLPTRNDFLQADLNGLRFVMKKENETQGLWTSTIRGGSEKRGEAWIYNSQEGTLTADSLDSEHGVRCVGAALR